MSIEVESANTYEIDSTLAINPLTPTTYQFSPPSNNDTTTSLLQPSPELSWDLLDKMHISSTTATPEMVAHKLIINPERQNRTRFRFKRQGITGEIGGYSEEVVLNESGIGSSGSGSMSVNRGYSSKNESIRGRTSFLPFQPGGLMAKARKDEDGDGNRRNNVAMLGLHRNEIGLFDVPPGFARGLSIGDEMKELDISELGEGEMVDEDESDGVISMRQHTVKNLTNVDESRPGKIGNVSVPVDAKEIEGLVPFDYSTFKYQDVKSKEKRTWAHVVDLDHKIEDFHELVPNMARTWPFELDTFQKEAVFHLEQGDSVFVAAHTSAGKTVVAEYAIAMATRNMTKAIYTSPIKALSNQKFRDFKETFQEVDVGLITGDVQINPQANCLIMTTEILRSMLYRGADLIRDVEFVIFDEVHYVNDIDRGVVWEEVIIMLPDHVKFILLSATVPLCKLKRLTHPSCFIFVSAKTQLFKVVDSNRRFMEGEFKKHKDLLDETSKKKKELPTTTMGSGSRGGPGGSARGGNRGGGRGGRGGGGRGGAGAGGGRGGGGGGGRGGGGGGGLGRGNFSNKPGARRFGQDGPNKNTWIDMVHYLKNNTLLPAVIFVFSKKKCEDWAETLRSIDFCTAKEKSEIHMFIDRAVGRLKKEDRELPQILKIRDMLSRGIAVHHGGLLPIMKECIEILFAKTLVKVLFATETFAMGLNLPTRTVIFSTIRKHDGRSFRNLLPGEFTQMSGRAGRRGLDKTGTVIIMSYNDPLSPTDFKEVVLGTPTKLSSQFRLTYNMILNLLRIEALRVEEMIKHSFSENSTQVLLPENQKRFDVLTDELKEMEIEPCQECNLAGTEECCELLTQYEQVYGACVTDIHKSPLLKTQFLRIGRLVCFRDKNDATHVGFVIKSDSANDAVILLTFDHGEEYEKAAERDKLPYIPHSQYMMKNFSKIKFNGRLRSVSVPYENIQFIGRYSLKVHMADIIANHPGQVQEASVQIKLVTRYQNNFEEMHLGAAQQLSLHELADEKDRLFKEISQNPKPFTCSQFKKHYRQFRKRYILTQEVENLQRLISDENLDLLPDYEQRLEVLESLGFIDEHHNVVLKGRVACEINSGWELIITELVLDNFLGDFEPSEIVALLSCFVYEGRTKDEEPPLITPRLERGKQKILEIANKLLKVYTEKQVSLTTEEEDFVESKRFALVNVVYEWANGLSFNEIMQVSVEAEGTIVRVITRLDEICREVKNAALIIGDSTLHLKMAEAQERIKRDIVFCASLYL
ncbi:SKI2 [[Candida] subhashii]|uniref:SKI2 n=1 Tax=[Candida] subhashii TaxID=561895 RepID=A0A8J5QGJ6_9ASCO|nr:SKI2 [[Candida] subhashii]KAG7660967.1 SKI2 [[Candida] subhashii]